MFEGLFENLRFQRLLTQEPMKFVNLVLQSAIIRSRHDLFPTAGRGQAVLRHQPTPSEQLVWGRRHADEPPGLPSYPARRSLRPCEPGMVPRRHRGDRFLRASARRLPTRRQTRLHERRLTTPRQSSGKAPRGSRASLQVGDEMNSAQTRRAIAAGVIGNVLEWYDFAIYGYFASAIGRQFFPHEDAVAQLLS